VLELDELWSFVGKRSLKRWVWLALCRRTRQIVAYAIGSRGQETCQVLWERIPLSYKASILYTDFWDAYTNVLPAERHRATGKGAGQTCHVERFNDTLRQRTARLVRKTLSFSKLDTMHDNCLRLTTACACFWMNITSPSTRRQADVRTRASNAIEPLPKINLLSVGQPA